MMMSDSHRIIILGVLIIFTSLTCGVKTEKPKHVVFMHGILSDPSVWNHFEGLVKMYVPGTPVTKINAYNHLDSLMNPMWTQVNNISLTLRPILTNTSSETVLVCFSQGGLICRGILSLLHHNVVTFISLSAPLSGQYGDTSYLKFLFPLILKKNAYRILYSEKGQDLSIGNYWNDPHQQTMYKKFSNYLAQLNNESDTVNEFSEQYKANFLRLKQLVLVGGPDDGVITPWQASQFGMYNGSEIVLPMAENEWYKNDAFGLRTLDERKAIKIYTLPGVKHIHWHARDDVFNNYVLPYIR